MKLTRQLLLYSLLIVFFVGLIFGLLHLGGPSRNPGLPIIQGRVAVNSHAVDFIPLFQSNLKGALPRLLLQVVIILASTQVLGLLFKRIRQPAVIGEIVAGMLLGPSLLGVCFPRIFHFVFPVDSLPNLHLLSQFGLILFMFIIGMELDGKLLKKQAFEAVIISHASIVIPFALGVLLSFYLYPAHGQTEFYAFALFMGIAMSITAFPVLARIIRDRKLTDTPLGILSLGCAASDDVTAWCLLAILIALVRGGSGVQGLYTIGLVILFALIMILGVRRLLKKIQFSFSQQKLGLHVFTVILFVVLFLSAWCTEVIGIQALFGAFLAGIIVPKQENLQKKLIEKMSDLTLILLLPLFFAYTGLRTQVGILNTPSLWFSLMAILFCAVLGKFGGSTLVARALGQSWNNSLSIGALLNTRGLMELVVLNLGYDMGVLSTEIFSMMVLMALLTTMMTGPILDWIARRQNH